MTQDGGAARSGPAAARRAPRLAPSERIGEQITRTGRFAALDPRRPRRPPRRAAVAGAVGWLVWMAAFLWWGRRQARRGAGPPPAG